MSPVEPLAEPPSLRRIRMTVWAVALAAALFAAGQTITHLALGRSRASPENLALAERWLLRPGLHADWTRLVGSGRSAGSTVTEWLDTVELASLQRRQFPEALTEEGFRDHILSPQLAADQVMTGGLRRELWRHFAPRVRKETDVGAAAAIIARELRARVTPQAGADATALTDAWALGMANPAVWETLYVAALRSTGIASRIGEPGKAELWQTIAWQVAPRPLFDW